MRIKPKKRLGQNFLVDANIREKIIAACNLSAADVVLEIGTGKGEITALLAAQAGSVISLELDPLLYKILHSRLAGVKNVEVVHANVLKFDFESFFLLVNARVKVVGNIPYYITTPIVELLIAHREKISAAYIMVQKEFAQRAVASPGSKTFGALSCFIQYYTVPRILFPISKASFSPAPKVDSCFMELTMLREPAVKVNDEALFRKVIRAGFNQRRKTLRNSLEDVIPQQKLSDFFARYGIDQNIRPECMSLADFANLANCNS
jgi:16S rRNA (adenine1518-N6/adenine1519-N6)-dimethyltransferase